MFDANKKIMLWLGLNTRKETTVYRTPTNFNALENDDEVAHDRCVPASAMTLRDYFAAKAMQAFIASAANAKRACNEEAFMDLSHLYGVISDEAYILADTMMSSRDVP